MKKIKNILIASVLAIVFVTGIGSPTKVSAAGPATVNLGLADHFRILGKTAISTTGATSIIGDIGVSPAAATFITGFGLVMDASNTFSTSSLVTGKIYAADYAGFTPSTMTTAISNIETAYTDAAGRPTPDGTNLYAGIIGGQTFAPGLYKWTTDVSIADDVTLSGSASDVWIFQISGNMTIASAKSILLIGGAQASNIFWQVAGGTGATLGTTSVFEGTILTSKQIIMQTGATLHGRALAQTQVTLDASTLSGPGTSLVLPTAGAAIGTINVVKVVVNDNGGTKIVSDFPLFVNGKSVISGITNTFSITGVPYTITETSNANYTRKFSGDCDVNGQLNLINGDNKFCIITNNDIGTSTPSSVVPPLIDVVKTANPLSLPNGPGLVQYTYTLRNIGTVPVTGISMVGDTCSPIVLISGDTNNNSILEVNEVWVNTCSTTLLATHTNNVVTHGMANGITATDIASATVIVGGGSVVPPLIHITTIPTPTRLYAGGGTVTYIKKVTNPGTVALSNVSITDDKCSNLNYLYGDFNLNNQLDTNETWIYSCKTTLTQTTTNTVIATGVANGLTARDFAITTIVVATTPGLPNTGFPPKSNKLNLLVGLVGIIGFATILYVNRKKITA